jgi:hypothetical protein
VNYLPQVWTSNSGVAVRSPSRRSPRPERTRPSLLRVSPNA